MHRAIKIFRRMFIIILGIAIAFLVNGITEYFVVQNKIKEFVNRGEFVEYNKYTNTYFYRVKKEHDYEDTSRNIIHPTNNWIGSTTDIFVTSRNPMRNNPDFSGLMAPLSKYFYIGHATINVTENGSRLVEVYGNNEDPEDNVVYEANNVWHIEDEVTPNVVGLRIKNTTEEQREQIVDYLKSKLGYPYNYTFLFNRNTSFYCTDLISRAVASVGININYDYLATTGNDMIISKNVYIFYYREIIKEEDDIRYNVYFLEEY